MMPYRGENQTPETEGNGGGTMDGDRGGRENGGGEKGRRRAGEGAWTGTGTGTDTKI